MNQSIFKDKKALAILSIGTITVLGSMAVSPALAGIKTAFPELDDSIIQLVLTIPPLFVIPACFLCRWMTGKIGSKYTLLVGLALYLLGGVGGGLMPGFYTMLAARAVLGISCGLLTPLAQTLISQYYTGETREKLTGYPASASYLMGIIASFTVGNIAAIHWRLAFLIYLLAIIVLVLNIKYLPNDYTAARYTEQKAKRIRLTAKSVLLMCGMFFVNIAFYTFSTSIALFMKGEHIGTDSTSGVVVAVFMTFGFVTGLNTAYIRRITKSFSSAIAAAAMGCGYLILWQSSSLLPMFISAALIGASYSVIYSNIFFAVGKQAGDFAENTKYITYTTAAMFAGQSVSGYALLVAEQIFRTSGYRFRFAFLGLGLVIAGCVIGIFAKRTRLLHYA